MGIKLLPLLPHGSTYTGIDLSEELLKAAEKLFENSPYQSSFIRANLVNFNPSKKYDLAICQAVLRHIPQFKIVLKKMVDAVIENGKVICIEVNRKMENAGLYVEGIDVDFDERDANVKNQWINEIQSGGRDYLTGIKIPILMEEFGLRDVSVRVNDFAEFVSQKQDNDKYREHIKTFIDEHGLLVDFEKTVGISALNVRSLLISFGTKNSAASML